MPIAELRAVLEPSWERELSFSAEVRKLPRLNPLMDVTHFGVRYKQWDGPPLPWSEDFGKKRGQVYSRDGDEPLRSCNEVEVAKRLRRVRQHAFWISSYGPGQIPSIWRPWTRGPAEAPCWLLELDRKIRVQTRRASGGIPDVVAWNDADTFASALYVECKGTKETFKEGQEDWVTAARGCGVSHEQIAVAVREFV